VFAVFDDDVHAAGKAGELAGGGAGNHDDVELGSTVAHGGVVLEDESAGAAVECAGDAFDGHVATGSFGTAGGKHFAFAGGFEVAVKLLVEGKVTDRIFVELEGRVERNDFYFERSGGTLGHGAVLLRVWQKSSGEHTEQRENGDCDAECKIHFGLRRRETGNKNVAQARFTRETREQGKQWKSFIVKVERPFRRFRCRLRVARVPALRGPA
jgi:hypothetical protein